MVWYSHLLRIFQFVVIHTVKGFSLVNEAEADIFLEFSCFFYDLTGVGNLISGSSAFSKSNCLRQRVTTSVQLKQNNLKKRQTILGLGRQ